MSERPFRYLSIGNWTLIDTEASGRREKWWFCDPVTGRLWLFKPVTIKGGCVHGEDWAEKIACHLANMIGLPCAEVELAYHRTQAGSMALDLKPQRFELQEGQVLLSRFDDFVPHAPGMRNDHPGHTLEHVAEVLEGVRTPYGWEAPFSATAFDVFAGYLMFDGWIANSDRHEQNWAVLRDPPTLYLASSYDHSSSLGWNVRDSRRQLCINDPHRMTRWCSQGIARCFEPPAGKPVPSLVEHAAMALAMASPVARAHWLRKLELVSDSNVGDVVSRTPGMSELARTFVMGLLDTNRRRLLDAC